MEKNNHLNDGTGNPCAGQKMETSESTSCSECLYLDSADNLGARVPTGSNKK